MTRRSLQASSEGIKKAKAALIRNSLTQQQLADELNISRQPVSKFFQGKSIERYIFQEICIRLDLDWEMLVSSLWDTDDTASISELDNLVQQIREKIKPSILKRCGIMRVLDMTQPMQLNDIYTDVNILEKITGERWIGNELLQETNFERFGLSRITEERVPALKAVEKYSKLMILGKAGSGKTTFLKYLAIQCINREFLSCMVPIFVNLKDFAEVDDQQELLEYIIQASSLSLESQENANIKQLLISGRMLILLDGLDEVKEEYTSRVFKDIREFSDRFQDNYFVITSRIAAVEYTFEQFTEVEIADFDDKQIALFVMNWFQNKDLTKLEKFLQKLQENQRIKELANSPLLLTLLCLVFEEIADFPVNRSELYKEAVDILLKKWDAMRGIERDKYKQLSLQRKQDLLRQIAWNSFVAGEYFFKQKFVTQQITDYIRSLPDLEGLQLDSEAILKSIEVQHSLLIERAKGIYSFSHISLHEYFVAQKFVFSSFTQTEEVFQNLLNHITDNRWREIFLLIVEMLPNADDFLLLMKDKIESLSLVDEKLCILLKDCLNSDCYVSRQVRKEIEDAF
ncbi:NACHT domain-containing NTPase [Scytonema hofmannii FACHB-248]|uniref:NACHT domain-containing NTPase n=1 Tax=Scytonema hofmannii FACHB-248 TaxID=1842502 RepID=A0ABR8H1F2_9CYAN|nr:MULTISPECIES: NACHT domain-containing protein [Nostocales]MBD2609344.1 NACHT domain-containing NTPase [Scytonema hofmannii FACHB-248]